MITSVIIAIVGIVLAIFAIAGLTSCLVRSSPNEALIFTGRRRREGGRLLGYRVLKGGTGFRLPLLERVDRVDLTNMVIDLAVSNAYSKGGVPLTVQGVANVKIAGHEPVLNNSVERFLGKSRLEVVEIARATLEGALRGVLATMTPEQVNDDKIVFAEKLVQEVEQDMTNLGLVVDTLKIQNVQDEVQYLNSLGRKQNAEVVSKARIAEAIARADSKVRSAENLEQEVDAQITAQTEVAKAEAHRRLTDALTRRDALIAEELAQVQAQLAQATAEIAVQKARVEQTRRRLDADVVQPAKASCEAAEEAAKAAVAPIIEDGKARAEALRTLSQRWRDAGPAAREILLLQKLEPIVRQFADLIAETHVERVTVIDSRVGGQTGSLPVQLKVLAEQLKEVLGVDVLAKVQALGAQAPARVDGPPAD